MLRRRRGVGVASQRGKKTPPAKTPPSSPAGHPCILYCDSKRTLTVFDCHVFFFFFSVCSVPGPFGFRAVRGPGDSVFGGSGLDNFGFRVFGSVAEGGSFDFGSSNIRYRHKTGKKTCGRNDSEGKDGDGGCRAGRKGRQQAGCLITSCLAGAQCFLCSSSTYSSNSFRTDLLHPRFKVNIFFLCYRSGFSMVAVGDSERYYTGTIIAATGTSTVVAHCHTGYNPLCQCQAVPQALYIAGSRHYSTLGIVEGSLLYQVIEFSNTYLVLRSIHTRHTVSE